MSDPVVLPQFSSSSRPPIGDWSLMGEEPTAMDSHARYARARSEISEDAGAPADLSFRLGDPEAKPSDPQSFQRTRSHATGRAASVGVRGFPGPGEEIGGFRIVSELGRGAFARVYLAEQVELAGRLVALKVAQALGDEPQALARLQHTHIVPIYSVHDDRATGLRLLCMPFVGGANLAQVLERSGASLPTQVSGRSLLEALDRLNSPRKTLMAEGHPSVRRDSMAHHPPHRDASPSVARSVLGRYLARLPWWKALEQGLEGAPYPSEDDPECQQDRVQPARRFLRSHTYVQAAAWIAARLAEGLDHAHARGILHRDLKPSNILIAADGTPMLLDFNLAADANEAAKPDADRAHLGGTLPYMAPEHLDAFNPHGHTAASAVDERSDIYAIGLILYEMVAGRHPFEEPPAGRPLTDIVEIMTAERREGAPPARTINPMVPPSLDAIIAKAMAPEPSKRYARAADLAEDLQRFLDDRPNAYAPEPSLKERSAKWWRRHPEIRGAGPVAATAAILLFTIVGAAWSIADYAERAQARLMRNSFRDDFKKCQLWLNTTSGTSENRRKGIEQGTKLLKIYAVETSPDWMKGPLVRRLPSSQQRELREDVAELILLMVRARVLQAMEKPDDDGLRLALRRGIADLDRAEAIDPHPSAALFESRAHYYNRLGEAPQAKRDLERAEVTPPRAARDFYLRGTYRLANNDLDGAESDLAKAVALDPRRFWAWFMMGLCHVDMGHFTVAVGDFNACTLLAPEFAWPYLNRGLALAAIDRLAAARASYDRAIALDPDFAEALVNRALVCLQLDDPSQALADLNRAVELGRHEAPELSARAEALARLGHRDQAEAEFAALLKMRPYDARILVARGISRLVTDPQGAQSDFDRVLAIDPEHPLAHLGKATLVRATDLNEARRHADRALARSPSFIDAIRLRAVVLGRLGDPAALADAERLVQSPSAHNLYNAACSVNLLDRANHSRTHRDLATQYLARALAMAFPLEDARNDPDVAEIFDAAASTAKMAVEPR